jgi:hypothetical protein
VRVRDSNGVSRVAPLLATHPDRLEYKIPTGTANRTATVIATTVDGSVFTGRLNLQTVIPRIFPHPILGYGDSKQAPARVVLRVRNGHKPWGRLRLSATIATTAVSCPIESAQRQITYTFCCSEPACAIGVRLRTRA